MSDLSFALPDFALGTQLPGPLNCRTTILAVALVATSIVSLHDVNRDLTARNQAHASFFSHFIALSRSQEQNAAKLQIFPRP